MTQPIETIEMLQAILKSIDEGIHVVNAEGKTIYYNHVIAELDGLTEEEVIGRHILDVFPSLNTHTSTLLQVIQTGKPIVNQSQTYTNIKGKQLDTVNTTLPIHVANKLVGAVEVAKDISKVKQLSEMLLELQAEMNAARRIGRGSQATTKSYFQIENFITQDEAMKQLKKSVLRVAKTDSPVLVHGKTGTGKEIIVQSLHSASTRKQGPFIAQNCAALPSSLLESLLFGTTKGSFTGSVDRAGLFQLADGGTLFLDEINSMPIELQSRLLRVLQEGMVRRIGGNKTYPVNVRIVAAMNEDPLQAVKEGRLRSDLYYRIHVVSLYLSPLKERKADIPLLIQHFLDLYTERFGRQKTEIEPLVIQKMIDYQWPGNVRELEHAIEAAMNMVEGHVLKEEHFPESLQQIWGSQIVNESTSALQLMSEKATAALEGDKSNATLCSLKERLEAEEKHWIQRALQANRGNIKQAAEALQLPRQTLQYKIKKYDIVVKE
jgi:arginine utilization regulatory protein